MISHFQVRSLSDWPTINEWHVIKLVNRIDFVQPICLPPLRNAFDDPAWFTVAGWGKTEIGELMAIGHVSRCLTVCSFAGGSSDVKLKAVVPLVSRRACQVAYEKKLIADDQLCAGGQPGIDSCRGDSGGPLMANFYGRWFAHGIVSHGPNRCGTPNMPGVYTNVSYYLRWIYRKVINNPWCICRLEKNKEKKWLKSGSN